ncbi:MAG: T9SS type A sorting domain-containing protein, partial [Bacteroidota bacterium]|nr:T9SS type A sorting domain-containing protein [Bacteroidota bacterium]
IYTVMIAGTITPCSPAIAGGVVSITSVQGTMPSINITTPLSPNCEFGEVFEMTSATGWFTVSASCMNGTMASASAQYQITAFGGSDTLFINLDCTGGSGALDCTGIPNGPNVPGTSCDDNDPNTVNDTWAANCICSGISNPGICDAGFWVVQAYENDPVTGQPIPTPYNLWVWNLSTGASPFQYLWNFGDGTSSTEAFPTHIYPSTGPYYLCLGIWDATGCTDTYCDTISIDGDGIYQGMIPGGGNDRNVLTIQVTQTQPSSISEMEFAGLNIWPNPTNDLLNLDLGIEITGRTHVSIIDVNGRLVRTMDRNFNNGTSKITLPVSDLNGGMYMIRIENGDSSIARRFVKNQ